MDVSRGLKIAVGVGLGLGAVALLASCAGPKEQDPHDAAFDLLGDYDKNGDGISRNEAQVRWEQRPVYGDKRYGVTIGDKRYWERNVGYREWTMSTMKAVLAADSNNNAFASWEELTSLAAKFNTDGNATLSRKERRAFEREYGPQRIGDRHVWTGTQSGWDDVYPTTPGNGHTSPGDDGGGSTSPGDDPAPRPGNGGTSGGDDPVTSPGNGNGGTSGGDDPAPARPTPVPSGGGNSSDNGNPSEDDF